MEASAQIIRASTSKEGIPIYSIQLEYNRYIHGEFLTHRVFSRSSASSRAIPSDRFISMIRNTPAMPLHYGKNQSGMQADEELEPEAKSFCESLILDLRDTSIATVQRLAAMGLHKQIANRYLEPWMRMRTILTTTDLANFMNLRDHRDAQPEMRDLAQKVKEAVASCEPELLLLGEWHLPYVRDVDYENINNTDDLKKVSAARCARVSYLKHDGTISDLNNDIKLFDRLITSKPVHASPAEHQATPDVITGFNTIGTSGMTLIKVPQWDKGHEHGNFRGWRQFRKMIQDNTVIG